MNSPAHKNFRRVRVSSIPPQVAERIRRAYEEGIRGKALVERFGLSLTTLMRVVRP